VNLKEYEGTGAALSLIEQSQPGDWDVLVIDGIDVPRIVEVMFQGIHRRVRVEAAGLTLLAHLPLGQGAAPGDPVMLAVDTAKIVLLPSSAPVLRTGGASRPWAMASP
jgi:hypothetical protein